MSYLRLCVQSVCSRWKWRGRCILHTLQFLSLNLLSTHCQSNRNICSLHEKKLPGGQPARGREVPPLRCDSGRNCCHDGCVGRGRERGRMTMMLAASLTGENKPWQHPNHTCTHSQRACLQRLCVWGGGKERERERTHLNLWSFFHRWESTKCRQCSLPESQFCHQWRRTHRESSWLENSMLYAAGRAWKNSGMSLSIPLLCRRNDFWSAVHVAQCFLTQEQKKRERKISSGKATHSIIKNTWHELIILSKYATSATKLGMLSLHSTNLSALQVIWQWAHLHANQYADSYQKSAAKKMTTRLMIYMK